MSIKKSSHYDVIVLGAGGAGLMAAATAGQCGRRVLVLDHADAAGKKILISGGGRCNFTNIDARPECYLSDNPHFAKSALSRYTAQDFIDLVERHNIAWHEKTLGQLFCDNSAKQIVTMLLDECGQGDVTVSLSQSVTRIEKHEDTFHLTTQTGMFTAQSLIIATGGPSIPKLGATGFAYDIARQFKLKVVEPRPALVPFTLGGDEVLFRELSGIASFVTASNPKAAFDEAALFTHKGLSGPAILQISSYWRSGEAVAINFFPNEKSNWLIACKAAEPASSLKKILTTRLPERLATALLEQLEQDMPMSGDIGNIKDAVLHDVETRLSTWQFHPNGTEGMAKAEVTIGGVSTAELSSRTMEAKKVPGLYFIGEAVDVTGWLGGYNFQWAWASGVAAGEVA